MTVVNVYRFAPKLQQEFRPKRMDPNTLLVNVGCARGLFLKNHGSLDAFATVVLQGRGSMRSRATTEQIHTEGDCRWDENCEFKINEKSTHLTISVQHKTRIGGSDLIGRCEVPLEQARRLGGQMWFPLKKRKDDDKYRGEIQLNFTFTYEKPSLSISNVSLNKIEKDGMLDKMKRKIKIRKHKQAEDTMSVTSGISAISMRSSRSHRFIDKLNKTFGGLHKSSTLQHGVLSHTYEEGLSYDSSNLLAPPNNFFRDRDDRFRPMPTFSGIDSHADESLNLSIPPPNHSTPMQDNRVMPSSPTVTFNITFSSYQRYPIIGISRFQLLNLFTELIVFEASLHLDLEVHQNCLMATMSSSRHFAFAISDSSHVCALSTITGRNSSGQPTTGSFEDLRERITSQKLVYSDPLVQRMLIEMHSVFEKCRNITRVNNKMSSDETLSLSREYRSVLHSSCEAGEDETGVFSRDYALWSLFEAMFFKAGESFSFLANVVQKASIEIDEGVPIDQSSYWRAVCVVLICCRFDICIDFLRLLKGDSAAETFIEVISSLNLMWLTDETKIQKLDTWKSNLRAQIASHIFDSNRNIVFLAQLLTGDQRVLTFSCYNVERAADAVLSDWWQLMPFFTLSRYPTVAYNELGPVALECRSLFAKVKPSILDEEFDPFLAVFNLGDVSVLQNLLSNPWLSVHLVDTMYHTDSSYALPLLDIRKFLIMEYGSGLIQNSCLWEIGADYLLECGVEGRLRLENHLESLCITDEAIAEKILRLCIEHDLEDSKTCVINTMTFRYLREGEWSASLSWALRGGRGKTLDTTVHRIVWGAKEDELAVLCLLDHLGDLVLLSPALTFLFGYYRFHRSLNIGDVRAATQVLIPLIVSPDVPSSFHQVLFGHLMVILAEIPQVQIPRDTIYQLLSFFKQHTIDKSTQDDAESCDKPLLVSMRILSRSRKWQEISPVRKCIPIWLCGIRRLVCTFVKRIFVYHIESRQNISVQEHFPIDIMHRAGEIGFGAIYCNEEFGGSGLTRLHASVIFEQLAAGCVSTAAYMSIHNMFAYFFGFCNECAWMIDTYGSEYLREKYLPSMSTFKTFASYCLTEPDAGSDAANLRTSARKQGDYYVVNGSKAFISGAGSSQNYIVMVRHHGQQGAKGIFCLLIEDGMEGFSTGKKESKLGWNTQPTRILTFEDVKVNTVRVPIINQIGPNNFGFNIAMAGLNGGRLNIASCSLGAAQQSMDLAIDHLKVRKQFGKSLADFQWNQFKLAEMAAKLYSSRLIVREAARNLEENCPQKAPLCAMAKLHATENCSETLMLSRLYSRAFCTSAAAQRSSSVFVDRHEIAFPIAGKQPQVVPLKNAFRQIKSGDNIFVHGIAATPTPLLNAMCEYVMENDITGLKLHHLHLEGATPWTASEVNSMFITMSINMMY
uniref:Nuclear pore complex protein Nup85 n=1 Tax=Heterorhabditis bacteriophora TaxID=37862 RepID=A0A1I7XP74_HETBA